MKLKIKNAELKILLNLSETLSLCNSVLNNFYENTNIKKC